MVNGNTETTYRGHEKSPPLFSLKIILYGSIACGWCLGSNKFRQELLALAEERVGASHYGEETRETEEEKA